eukprot:UN06117
MILLVDLGTDLLPAISMAYEGKEADIMHRKPRNPEKDNLVTWRLVSFSYLQIGMLQAISGFYAYATVLHSFGIQPNQLIGLDLHFIFDYDPGQNEDTRDAYWLYCWDNDKVDFDCQYFPNFGSLNDAEVAPFYDDEQWNSWIDNNDEFVKNAKNYLIDRFGEQEFDNPTNTDCNILIGCCFGLNNQCTPLTYDEWISVYWG